MCVCTNKYIFLERKMDAEECVTIYLEIDSGKIFIYQPA